jgi:hypothetical protein
MRIHLKASALGFLSRPPRNSSIVRERVSLLDEQMAEVADFFAGKRIGDTDVLAAANLQRKRLDFSVESLKAVDEWLARLHADGVEPSASEAAETIVWTGAYVGEVIRRNSSRAYRWMHYEEYMASQDTALQDVIPYSFGTQFVLTAGAGVMTLPINKVGRWLDEGPQNDLHFYASAEVVGR